MRPCENSPPVYGSTFWCALGIFIKGAVRGLWSLLYRWYTPLLLVLIPMLLIALTMPFIRMDMTKPCIYEVTQYRAPVWEERKSLTGFLHDRVHLRYTSETPHNVPQENWENLCMTARYCFDYAIAKYVTNWEIRFQYMLVRHALILLCMVWLIRKPSVMGMLLLFLLIASAMYYLVAQEIFSYIHPHGCECPQHKLR